MQSFVIHVSDLAGVDDQALVVVENHSGLGAAAQMAIDQIVKRHGGSLAYPVFVDIHPAPVGAVTPHGNPPTPVPKVNAPLGPGMQKFSMS